MTNENINPFVSSDELITRFVFQSNWFRKADKTITHNAFMPRPEPHLDLSVTRCINISQDEIFRIGNEIAMGQGKTFYGRTNLRADDARRLSLDVESSPVPKNQNHANIVSWPRDKAHQKSIAQQLAAGRKLIENI